MWTNDQSGVAHFRFDGIGIVYDALQRALDTMPDGVCWFWWNGTFAPILISDKQDPGQLYNRWSEWREAHQAGKLLAMIHTFTGIR